MWTQTISVFFPRENQNPFRENFGQFLGFHSWKNFSFRENFAKTARENTRCVRENFFQITYVKMEKCVRENITYSFREIWWNLSFFVPVKKNCLPWKISKFRYFLPVKMKIHPWKNPTMRPWKLLTARENLAKSVRESHFSFREKSPKKAENGFHGHFWFSREKKNADLLNAT